MVEIDHPFTVLDVVPQILRNVLVEKTARLYRQSVSNGELAIDWGNCGRIVAAGEVG